MQKRRSKKDHAASRAPCEQGRRQFVTTARCCSTRISGNIGNANTHGWPLRWPGNPLPRSRVVQTRLPMQRDWVIDLAANPSACRCRASALRWPCTATTELIVLPPMRRISGRCKNCPDALPRSARRSAWAARRRWSVQRSRCAASAAQHGRLQGRRARIPTHDIVMIFRLHAVNAQTLHRLGPSRITGDHHAARRRKPPRSSSDKSSGNPGRTSCRARFFDTPPPSPGRRPR